ncbi:MAG: RNA polymerase sigma-70 factor (ECF subfamily) [Planctomycetota bacterium]|jgi:RNA polymerase sigma-70 factor (ECF subfamily)
MHTVDPNNSRQQFAELLHQHQRIVAKVASVYSYGAQEREDLSQEIILQLWRAWPGFRAESSFATWAFRVALNTALFQRRKSHKGRVASLEDGSSEPAAPKAADPAEAREDIELLQGCIRALPELDRALVLMHLEARPQGEIAEFTGLSVGNVGVRLHRIRHTLRECLSAHGYTEEPST